MDRAKEIKSIYRSDAFREQYTYLGSDLGMACDSHTTSFALWSPLAKSAEVLLYRDGSHSLCCRELPMVLGKHGVWRCSVEENLHGHYYQYRIMHEDGPIITADPYAKGCGLNGQRSMILDMKKTDPEDWELDKAPALPPENIIYELHVKEFSWQQAAGLPEAYRGKYKAFTCTDTTLYNDKIHPTGVSYLRDLGVTYIQLMPVYDYGSVDERKEQEFNWGYDPVNYNVPEGAYSTDPARGEIRIREFKEMIQSLHKNGFRVIMDVVYNHTYTADSSLNRAVPWYYYRLWQDGAPSNGSGCGNEIASEYPMCTQFIVNSILYWAQEYHIDGFRFDLMGLLDVDLMNRIRGDLDSIYGRGEKLLFGEPWSAGNSAMETPARPALKCNISLLDDTIGIFSDDTRDAVKGHVFDAQAPGFVNGGFGMEQQILHAISGWRGIVQGVKSPAQIVSYISAHDNWTLWDKLSLTVSDPRERMQCNKLAAAIYMTCQGNLFFLSGEEFARTKGGLSNTYRSPLSINRLDWERAYQYSPLREYYGGLISLRKQLPGLCDKSSRNRILKTWTMPGFVACAFDNTMPGGGRWKVLYLLYNSTRQNVEVPLPEGSWQLLLTGESSFSWAKNECLSGCVTVPPISAAVLGFVSDE